MRKGGIRENRGEFLVDHREFWLFPTQFHEAERSIIPSKRPALREIAARMVKDAVDIEFFVVADPVLRISDVHPLKRLQGRHIWNEQILQQRFESGREPGLHALIARVYRLPAPQQVAMHENYGGCKSWIELERTITADVTPVLTDAEFAAQREEICELISGHALAHP
ncbi:MAG: DUF1802 family protein [Verrucomicrobiia bacterium]